MRGIAPLDPAWVARTVAIALDEDLGAAPGRDVTTQATIGPDVVREAHLVARAAGVVAGLPVVAEVLRQVAALACRVAFTHQGGAGGQPVGCNCPARSINKNSCQRRCNLRWQLSNS